MAAIQPKDWWRAWELVDELDPRQVAASAPDDHKLAGCTALHLAAFHHDPKGPSYLGSFYHRLCGKAPGLWLIVPLPLLGVP